MATTLMTMDGIEIQCPSCKEKVAYRYGKTVRGKQRFLCLRCERQFTLKTERLEMRDKPDCPACGKGMHLYKREEHVIRFRCSDYPVCKTFAKISTLQGGN